VLGLLVLLQLVEADDLLAADHALPHPGLGLEVEEGRAFRRLVFLARFRVVHLQQMEPQDLLKFWQEGVEFKSVTKKCYL
jgi:hypothetical protein